MGFSGHWAMAPYQVLDLLDIEVLKIIPVL